MISRRSLWITKGRPWIKAFLFVALSGVPSFGDQVSFSDIRRDQSWSLVAGSSIPAQTVARLTTNSTGEYLDFTVKFLPDVDFVGLAKEITFPATVDSISQVIESESAFAGLVLIEDSLGEVFLHRFEGRKGKNHYTIPISLETFTQHWGGDKNGEIDFPVQKFTTGVSARKALDAHLQYFSFTIKGDESLGLQNWEIYLDPRLTSGLAKVSQNLKSPDIILYNGSESARTAQVHLNTTAYDGLTSEISKTIQVNAYSEAILPLPLDLSASGYHQINLKITEKNVSRQWEFALAAIDDRNNEPTSIENSFFGLCEMEDLEAAKIIGARYIRKMVHWDAVEIKNGVFYLEPAEALLKSARRLNMSIIFTGVIRTMPPWLSANDHPGYSRNVVLRHIRRFFRQLAKVASKDPASAAIEIQNEPDISLLHLEGLSNDLAAEKASQNIKTAVGAIRDIDSKIIITGMGVSGMDFRQKLQLSRSVLPNVSHQLDFLSPHPYTRRRFVGRDDFASPHRYGYEEYLKSSVDLAEDFTRKGEIWITELGWGLKDEESPLSPIAIQQAAVIAQSMILARANNHVGKFTWFTGQSKWRENGYNFSLFRKINEQWFPLPGAIAFSTTTNLLEHSRFNEAYTLESSIIALKFVADNPQKDIFVLWAHDKPESVVVTIPLHCEIISLSGKRTKKRSGEEISLSQSPLFIKFEKDKVTWKDLFSK